MVKAKKISGDTKIVVVNKEITESKELMILDFLKLVRKEREEFIEKLEKAEIERLKSQDGKKVVEETEEQIKERDKQFIEDMEKLEQGELKEKEVRKHKVVIMNDAYWKEKDEAISTDKDKLIWIFRAIKKKKEMGSIRNGTVRLGYSEIIVKPFFILADFEPEFNSLFKDINADKDFYRKHNMSNYNPRFEISERNENNYILFFDFTDDFIKAYMRDKLGIKTNFIKEPPNRCILLKSGDIIGNLAELTWLFNLLLKKGEGIYTDGTTTAVRIKKIQEGPFSFFKDTNKYVLLESLRMLFWFIARDEEFFKKHNKENYHPVYFDNIYTEGDNGLVFFADFTDDFLKAYLEDEERLGMKNNAVINNGQTIQKIEIMIPNDEWEGIKMFINSNYNKPIKFKNGKYIELFYTLAQNQRISSSRGLVSYFNSNKANPLYKRTGFNLSKILTKNGNSIEPNIPILLKTSKFISHAINKASEENKKLKPA